MDELQQGNTHMLPLGEPTAQGCSDKDSPQQQASPTPLRIDETKTPTAGERTDKQTQTTIYHKDAMVQTNTPTQG